ncbi:flagellar FlbD family protein [Anaerotignum sp. MB30-C6]|uniref:flagellar FlbD family protein n=1 Tax=Anaerotignum sp. MB30-C6 TaxID=3070814 RepID=UPI0027DD637A|nr:flagellar FlbD family protein [Anaerotignum sp. MB30-C6]WMI80980.1 flagellar FlbD family protein [Anaerotignum sp. MB30-C6]
MIRLTKLNGEKFVLNCEQIVAIECIPESKVILHNFSFYIVRETPDEIIQKAVEYLILTHSLNINPRFEKLN